MQSDTTESASSRQESLKKPGIRIYVKLVEDFLGVLDDEHPEALGPPGFIVRLEEERVAADLLLIVGVGDAAAGLGGLLQRSYESGFAGSGSRIIKGAGIGTQDLISLPCQKGLFNGKIWPTLGGFEMHLQIQIHQ